MLLLLMSRSDISIWTGITNYFILSTFPSQRALQPDYRSSKTCENPLRADAVGLEAHYQIRAALREDEMGFLTRISDLDQSCAYCAIRYVFFSFQMTNSLYSMPCYVLFAVKPLIYGPIEGGMALPGPDSIRLRCVIGWPRLLDNPAPPCCCLRALKASPPIFHASISSSHSRSTHATASPLRNLFEISRYHRILDFSASLSLS